MVYGVLAAVFAALAYGTSSVLQAYGARQSKQDAVARGDTGFETATGGPTMRATIAAVLTGAFIVGTVLDVLGFAGNAVASRLAPLFLSQTIVSSYLVVTAIAAGLGAGAMFGVVAVSVRILNGISDFDIIEILSDPAAYAILLTGAGGYYLNTVALQLGSVNAATAAVVVGETVLPAIVGIIWLGDDAVPGRTWLAVTGFVVAVAGAMVIAWSGAAQAANAAEAGKDVDAARLAD